MTTVDTRPKLWRHQQAALDFIGPKRASLLHMGMGTGKTRVAVEAADRWEAKRLLILAPLSVLPTWTKHLRESPRGWVVAEMSDGTTRARAAEVGEQVERARGAGRPIAVIVNYEAAKMGDLATRLASLEWDLLILDESHKIKAPGGKASWFVAQGLAPATRRRLALTGTPMPHSPLDVYAQFRALDASIFGRSFVAFRNKYAQVQTMMARGRKFQKVMGYRNQDDLARRMAEITFQCGREVLDLPEAVHVKIPIRLGDKARKAHERLAQDFRAQVEGGVIHAGNALVRLLRMHQVTSGFAAVEREEGEPTEEVEIDTAKGDALADILDGLPADEPVAVFCLFRHDLDIVRKVASALERGSAELSGRKNELATWQNGGAPVLAVQIQSGGVGIDLTRACHVVFYSIGFSLGDFDQALARAHRPGQTRTTTFHHLIAQGSIDEHIYGALDRRRNVVESILEEIKSARQPAVATT